MSSNQYMHQRMMKSCNTALRAGRVRQQFKDISIGQQFTFAGERVRTEQTIARGPWVKVSMWKYRHAKGGNEVKVRSLRAMVEVQP